jgi:outer membrane protein W
MKNNINIGTFKFKTATILTAILICLAAVSNISAQQTDESKKIEFSAGYSYTSPPQLVQVAKVHHGWTLGTAYKFTKRMSVYAEGGQDYARNVVIGTGPLGNVSSTATRTSILAGIRFHFTNKSRVTPFVNAGLGYVRHRDKVFYNGITNPDPAVKNLLIAAGGGLDIGLNRKKTISWRSSLEYRRVEIGPKYDPTTNTIIDSSGNGFRFSTGIVFNF